MRKTVVGHRANIELSMVVGMDKNKIGEHGVVSFHAWWRGFSFMVVLRQTSARWP